jgi:hypothetical protein
MGSIAGWPLHGYRGTLRGSAQVWGDKGRAAPGLFPHPSCAQGQRYRDVQPGIYGRSAASDWIVEAVQTDALGIRHARLVSVADPSERKTLAAEVLVDPARFEQV